MSLSALGATVVVASPPAGATLTTRYVATVGSDTSNTCTSAAHPCATVTHAVTVATSGDTIEVAGTIDDHVTVTGKSLTVTQWPGQAPAVLDGTNNGTVITVASGAIVTLEDLSVEHGSGGFGGGISNSGTLTLTASTVSGNAATEGGGIYNGTGGTVTITASTLSGNTAAADGGGIFNALDGILTVTDTTIYGNTAATDGGGIADGGTVTITASTVSDNTAADGGGIYDLATTVHVGATIVAANTASTGANCSGAVTSFGYNLTDDATGTACGFTQPTDVVGADAGLGPLADNGGPTLTMAPAAGGPATGHIPSGTTLNGVQVCPGIDQRGVARPEPPGGTTCTIGAVEVTPFTAPAITSAGTATFALGRTGSFQMTASGYPPPSFTESGALPSGVSLSSSGLLSGTPGPGTIGDHPITVTASNGVSPSATKAFTLTVTGPPAAPTITSGTGGTGSLTVSWSAPTTTGGVPVIYFVVEAVPVSGKPVTQVVLSPTTTATVSGLSAGTAYTVTVMAGNADGESPASGPLTVTTASASGGGGPIGPTAPTAPSGATSHATCSVGSGTCHATNDGVTVTASPGPGALTVSQYLSDPRGAPSFTPSGEYFDVEVATGSSFGSVSVKDCNLNGGTALYWWDPTTGTWETVSPVSGPSSTPPCLTAGLSASSTPSIPELTGTVLAVGTPAPPSTTPVAKASTSTSRGYDLVASDGGVFSFTAPFYGSEGGSHLNAPIVGMAADTATGGYWEVASDGGVFSFTAPFYGSEGGRPLDAPVVGMAAAPTGKGYWLVAADGGSSASARRPSMAPRAESRSTPP